MVPFLTIKKKNHEYRVIILFEHYNMYETTYVLVYKDKELYNNYFIQLFLTSLSFNISLAVVALIGLRNTKETSTLCN